MALALALKYRPTSFSDLIGQESVSQTLSSALDHNRISHAYLFSGLRGSGKTSSARIFSRALQCEKGPTSSPCGECDNCKSALENRHLDIIEMDAASSRKIDDIRDLIEHTKYRPSYGRYKIFIIDEVHMLTKEAFNALLKTLEEPPEYVKFILATTDPLKLPATILSRTQHFRFKKIPHKAVLAHIASILDKEEVTYESQALEIIARSGSGSLRDTLTITDQAINFCNKHITTTKVTEMLGVVDPQSLQEFFEAIFHNDEIKLQSTLLLLEEYECEMIIDEMMMFLKEALVSKNKDFPIIIVDRFLRILAESKHLLNINSDGSFVLLLLSLKMREATKLRDIDSMIKELESNLFLDKAKIQINTSNNPSKDSINTQIPTSSQTNHIPSESNDFNVIFRKLIAKIYDRSQKLGEIFEKNVEFISFEKGILNWKSSAQSQDKEILKQNYVHIKNIVQEIFGISTKINSIQTENVQEVQQSVNTQIPQPQIPQEPTDKYPDVEKSDHQKFIEENSELIKSAKIHLGATEIFAIENNKENH
ncbi:DNA polymerase III subunit gamma/tau [Helicobacter cappadocius]|uniref:DNA polymerase III subunit gamma/tau n=1 Tax=Helicobacter cappadocius TaxID=3063998 RepID=A0AA90PSV8_9HELI|nr:MULTISPECIES: DNA polymerase III subunit gamma/tau [unclassified Helicobacter]MDO7253619.1 DNA polymerase III subunit gamma/tau [Helicobacter sp. faydin-H75]MDP2539547.1 DNA polymerase III subunit gamma/tau [Helicobacter sp. faydin-H76]